MGNLTWVNALDPFPPSRGTAKNTFTAYQDIAGSAAVGLPQLQANELKVGSKLLLEAWGEYSCATGVTLSLGFLYGAVSGAAGGVAVGQSAAITTGTNPAAWPWHIHYSGVVTAIGTSGVMYGQAILDLGISLTTFAAGAAAPVTAAARSSTIDTTIAKLLGVGAAWSASAAGNTITVDQFIAKIVNQGKTS